MFVPSTMNQLFLTSMMSLHPAERQRVTAFAQKVIDERIAPAPVAAAPERDRAMRPEDMKVFLNDGEELRHEIGGLPPGSPDTMWNGYYRKESNTIEVSDISILGIVSYASPSAFAVAHTRVRNELNGQSARSGRANGWDHVLCYRNNRWVTLKSAYKSLVAQ